MLGFGFARWSDIVVLGEQGGLTRHPTIWGKGQDRLSGLVDKQAQYVMRMRFPASSALLATRRTGQSYRLLCSPGYAHSHACESPPCI